MRLLPSDFLVFLTVGAAFAASPADLVRQSIQNYKHNYLETALRYAHTERDEEKDGKDKVTISKVFIVNGLPYERVMSRNGQPLPEDLEAKEAAKLAKRQNESTEQREKRAKEYKNAMAFLEEAPKAFDFKMLPEETIDGRANYVIACTPKLGFRPANSRAAMLGRIKGKMWIDKEDIQWRRAEAVVVETISVGWIMARIGPGATMRLEQKPVGGHDWQTSVIDVNGDARVLLVKDHPIHEHVVYYDFRAVPPKATGNISELQTKR